MYPRRRPFHDPKCWSSRWSQTLARLRSDQFRKLPGGSVFDLRHLRSPPLPYLQATAWGMRGREARVRTGVTNAGDTVICDMSATARGLARELGTGSLWALTGATSMQPVLCTGAAPEFCRVARHIFRHIVFFPQVNSSGAWGLEPEGAGGQGPCAFCGPAPCTTASSW